MLRVAALAAVRQSMLGSPRLSRTLSSEMDLGISQPEDLMATGLAPRSRRKANGYRGESAFWPLCVLSVRHQQGFRPWGFAVPAKMTRCGVLQSSHSVKLLRVLHKLDSLDGRGR